MIFVSLVIGVTSTPIASRGVRAARAALPSASAKPSASAPALPLVASVTPSAVASAPTSLASPPTAAPIPIAAGTRVLVFGDSFVAAGLSQRLKRLVEDRGGKLVADAWTSSTTAAWASGDRLATLLAGSKPDVVLVSIGANEVFLPAPEARAQYVRAIVQRLGGRPCVWISTPLWKGETGITAVSRANAAPCTFFDSSALPIERNPDKIHPSPKGGAQWADAVWSAAIAPTP